MGSPHPLAMLSPKHLEETSSVNSPEWGLSSLLLRLHAKGLA